MREAFCHAPAYGMDSPPAPAPLIISSRLPLNSDPVSWRDHLNRLYARRSGLDVQGTCGDQVSSVQRLCAGGFEDLAALLAGFYVGEGGLLLAGFTRHGGPGDRQTAGEDHHPPLRTRRDRQRLLVLVIVVTAPAVASLYSEFQVATETVIKNDPNNMIKDGATITVERKGGRARMPSGRIVISWVSHQNMPGVGGRYVLFLTHNFETLNDTPKDFYLLTGYELRDGKVHLLDDTQPGHPITSIVVRLRQPC